MDEEGSTSPEDRFSPVLDNGNIFEKRGYSNKSKIDTAGDILTEQKIQTVSEVDSVDWDVVELNIETDDNVQTSQTLLRSSIMESHRLSSSDFVVQNREYSCFFCMLVCESKEALTQHLRTEHHDKTQCYFCKLHFTSLNVLLEHLYISHTKRNMSYVCKICPTSEPFQHESPLKFMRHINLIHLRNGPKENASGTDIEITYSRVSVQCHLCAFCQCSFVSSDNLFLHLVIVHEIDYTFAFKIAVRFSMFGKQVYPCAKCPKAFTLFEDREKHTSLFCEYFLLHYNSFTRFCFGCKTTSDSALLFEREHFFCPYNSCNEHGDNIVYRHRCYFPTICRHLINTNFFGCPECTFFMKSFSDLYAHYFSSTGHQKYRCEES